MTSISGSSSSSSSIVYLISGAHYATTLNTGGAENRRHYSLTWDIALTTIWFASEDVTSEWRKCRTHSRPQICAWRLDRYCAKMSFFVDKY